MWRISHFGPDPRQKKRATFALCRFIWGADDLQQLGSLPVSSKGYFTIEWVSDFLIGHWHVVYNEQVQNVGPVHKQDLTSL